MEDLSFLHLVILAMASFRLTHLVVYDVITEPVRKFFVVREFAAGPDGKRVIYVTVQGKGFRNWMGRMINCPWCAGIWVSGALTALYWWQPGIALPFALFLAIAGVQALITHSWLKSMGFTMKPGPKPESAEEKQGDSPAA